MNSKHSQQSKKPSVAKAKKTKKTPPGCAPDGPTNYSFDPSSKTMAVETSHCKTFKCKIDGIPRPQYRSFATTRASNKNVALWNVSRPNKESFTTAIQQAMKAANMKPFALAKKKPIAVTLRFFFPHPKHHYLKCPTTGALKLSPTAPVYVTKTPDIDNCTKLVLDALQGTCFANDSVVAHVDAAKQYDMTQLTWTKGQENKGCTIIKIQEFDEKHFDLGCKCLSCKHSHK